MMKTARLRIEILVMVMAMMSFRDFQARGEMTDTDVATKTYRLETVGRLSDNRLNESSGMAFSRIRPDVLWMINDGGNESLAFAVGLNGENLGAVHVNAPNRDWEDISSFRMDGEAMLMIADAGDNRSRHDMCFLIMIREPSPTSTGKYDDIRIQPLCRIPFRYEDGPRDCEAVAVDEVRRIVLLLSKRDMPPVLYALPLTTTHGLEPLVAKRIGVYCPLYRSGRGAPGIFDHPTAMDISPGGDRILVLTYRALHIFLRDKDQRWEDVLTGSPLIQAHHALPQAEAACFSGDGAAIYITSERRPAPLLRLDFHPSSIPEK